MDNQTRDSLPPHQPEPGITDSDVLEAMKEIPGYLDITPGDFKELYRHAYGRALRRIAQSVKARDIMTTDVLTTRLGASLKEVARDMAERGVAGIPVLGPESKVEGVISEKDFLIKMGGLGTGSFMVVVAECLRGQGCVAMPARTMLAGDIMSTPAITVGPGATLSEMAAILTERNINRLPVLEPGGRLVGIVSRADIVRAGVGIPGGTPAGTPGGG